MAIELMTFILPFLFVLAIVYGALELAAVFKNKKVNVIIALVVSVFAISSPGVVDTIVSAMPWAAMLFIILFFVKFILSFFKMKRNKDEAPDFTLLLAILGLILVFMLSQGTQLIQDWLPGGFPIDEDNFILIIGVIIIAVILYLAYKTKGEGSPKVS
jgi:hypothetical protein